MLKAGGLIVIDRGAVMDTDALSVTRTVKLLGPAVPGDPDIVPPAGRDELVMLKAGGLMVIDRGAVVDTDVLSVTRTVKLLGPAVPGDPDIVPPGARVNPAGSDPADTVHEYGGDPPEAASACE